MSFTLSRSSSLFRTSISQLSRTSTRSIRFNPHTTTLSRTFVSSSIRNMAPPAPAGLFSNRYKLEDIPDLSGKVAIVTGGSRGIGEGLVSALAKKGAEVHIIGATEAHAQEAIDHVISEHPPAKGKLHYHTVDLGSLASLRDLVKSTLAPLPRIDILYLIAGIGVAPFGLTQDGLPNHYAINVLSQFLLVDGLLPKMIETSKSKANGSELERFSTRIVSESSELHRASPSDVKCENLEELSQDIDETKLYGRSKLLLIYFIRELAKKHLPSLNSGNPIMAIAVHPGAVATEQQQGATEAYGLLGKLLEYAANMGFMSKEQGAESASWAGTGETVVSRREEVQGRYFTEADGKVDTESNQAKDDQVALNLWNLSVKTLKEKIDYDVKM